MQGSSTSARVSAQAAALCDLVASLAPGAVALGDAAGLWLGFEKIGRMAAAAQVVLAARVDESGVWQKAGCRSAAEWIARRSGSSIHGARGAVRVSKRLDGLALIDAAFRAGELSVAQLVLIVDAATADPSKEAYLLDKAGRLSLKELAEECGRIRAAADPDPDKTFQRIRAARRLRTGVNAEGAWWLNAQGTIPDGADLENLLAPLIDEMYDKARAEGRRDHRDTLAYDAFKEILRRYRDYENGLDPDQDDYDDQDDEVEAVGEDVGFDFDAEETHESEHDSALADSPDPAAGASDSGWDGVEREARDVDDDAMASRAGTGGRGRKDCPPGQGDGADITDDQSDTNRADQELCGLGGDDPARDREPNDLPTLPGIAPDPAAVARSTSRDNKKPRRRGRRKRSRDNPRYLGLLRVDLAAITRGTVDGDEICEVDGLGAVPVNVARSLVGDAIWKLVITKGVDVVHVTHLGRGPTVAQKIALLWTSPSCSNEACAHRFAEIDHREDWAHTRHTVLAELDRLCFFDHWLKTHYGWALVEGTGKRAFVAPDDPRHPKHTKQKEKRQAA